MRSLLRLRACGHQLARAPDGDSRRNSREGGERIAEHARQHALAEVRVILHGGEPLLAGATRLGEIAAELRAAIDPVCALDLRIHTNGVQLDEEFCEVFLAARVRVGISLDGDRAANDLHRRYAIGRSSYDQVIRAVALLPGRDTGPSTRACSHHRRPQRPGRHLRRAGRARSARHRLPASARDLGHPAARGRRPGDTPYADWLTAVFDDGGDDRRVPVRMFESIIRTSRGGASLTESLGLAPSDVAVIETDGAIEQADSIKVAYDGAPETGLDIFRNPLNEAAAHPAIQARQLGLDGLSDACRRCPVVDQLRRRALRAPVQDRKRLR